jgi:hypothetical protein
MKLSKAIVRPRKIESIRIETDRIRTGEQLRDCALPYRFALRGGRHALE